MLTNNTVADLLDAFSSSHPTPGGGSASALAGALGVSLLAMVAGMAKTKAGTPADRATLDDARTKLLELRRVLVDLVDRDAAAYDLVVAAYNKPRTTEEENLARTAAIQEAMRVATETPIATMRASTDAMRLAGAVAEAGNPSAKSDIGVAIHLLMAARQGAWFNVAVNVGSLKDPAVVETIATDLAAISDSATDLSHAYQAAGLLDLVRAFAGRPGFRAPKFEV